MYNFDFPTQARFSNVGGGGSDDRSTCVRGSLITLHNFHLHMNTGTAGVFENFPTFGMARLASNGIENGEVESYQKWLLAGRRASENLRPLIWLAVQFLFRCSLCFWLLWSLRVLGFPRLQLCGSVVHRGGPIHGEVCVLERAEVEVFPVVPSQEIRSDKLRAFTSSPASCRNASSTPS